MPSETQYIYWDSCVFLSYLNRYPARHSTIEGVFDEVRASGGTLKIVTSVFTMVEVVGVTEEFATQQLDPAVEAKIDALWADRTVVELVELHRGVIQHTRQLLRHAITQGWRGFKPKDAVHLGTARWMRVNEFNTYNVSDFRRFEGYVGFPICEPHPTQLGLL